MLVDQGRRVLGHAMLNRKRQPLIQEMLGRTRMIGILSIEPSAASWKAIWSGPSARKPRPGAQRKLSGKEEALLVATACAEPPAGWRRWTLALLADAMVKLTDHDSLSGETERRRLAK